MMYYTSRRIAGRLATSPNAGLTTAFVAIVLAVTIGLGLGLGAGVTTALAGALALALSLVVLRANAPP